MTSALETFRTISVDPFAIIAPALNTGQPSACGQTDVEGNNAYFNCLNVGNFIGYRLPYFNGFNQAITIPPNTPTQIPMVVGSPTGGNQYTWNANYATTPFQGWQLSVLEWNNIVWVAGAPPSTTVFQIGIWDGTLSTLGYEVMVLPPAITPWRSGISFASEVPQGEQYGPWIEHNSTGNITIAANALRMGLIMLGYD